ncbi:D-isomer specific 2-hydroxyacid dehydrogenase [Abortiporus biennis]|nr:D-isomer specific 2-hydroxyacid dehydrogenase [Abortiporus biennis]
MSLQGPGSLHSTLPRILICGDILYAQQECTDLFSNIAEIVYFASSSREDFLSSFSSGGAYEKVVGIYRRNITSARIGRFDREMIKALSERGVKWVAQIGAGYDQVDVQACKEFGIMLSHTPNAVNDSTATTALFLLISTFRQFSKAERDLRSGLWKTQISSSNSYDLHTTNRRTLAILGLGGIGLRFAQLVHDMFDMRIIYHNRHRVKNEPEWVEFYEGEEGLKRMLKEADVLSVHIPLYKGTEGLVGEKMIRGLKRGAILINTARGQVVDEEALLRALEDGHLGAAGLDVFPHEPKINPRLLEFPNVTILPHMGASTFETLKKLEVMALQNLRDFLVDGRGKDIVEELR